MIKKLKENCCQALSLIANRNAVVVVRSYQVRESVTLQVFDLSWTKMREDPEYSMRLDYDKWPSKLIQFPMN